MSGIRRTALLLAAALSFSVLAFPALASAAPAPLICIDPGHGGPYSNANANGIREKNLNLALSLELRRQLLAKGYRVVMTRTYDRAVTLSDIPTWNYSAASGAWAYKRDGSRNGGSIPKDDLQARVDLANAKGADLFIAVHNNGSASRLSRGTETFSSRRDPSARTLSTLVQYEVVTRTKLRNRTAQYADFYVIRWANMPSILVEGGFITNPGDAWLFKQAWFRRRYVSGVVTGVNRWFAARPATALYPRTNATDASQLAISLSAADYAPGVPSVVVVRSEQASDAPGAAVLAARLGAPLLFTGSTVSTPLATELGRLDPAGLVLVGMTGSFDSTLTRSLRTASGVATSAVQSVTAGNRLTLAAAIAQKVGVPATGRVALVRNGDAESMAALIPVATRLAIPLLIAEETTLGAAAGGYLRSQLGTATVVYAAGAVPTPDSTVETWMPKVVSTVGSDRFETSALLNKRFATGFSAGGMRPVVYDGRWTPDNLAVSVHAARKGQPTTMTFGRIMPARTREWISNARTAIGSFEIVDSRQSLPYLTDRILQKVER